MTAWNGLSGFLNTGRIGAGWQPKTSNVRVGRDVGALTATTFAGNTTHNTVIGHGDDVSLKSKSVFALAKSAAKSGYGAKQFRSVTDQDIEDSSIYSGKFNTVKNGDYSVTVRDGTLSIYKNNKEDGQPPVLVMNTAITEDSRLVWNENGEPELLTGNAARTKGVLQAQSAHEIIFSLSGSDVQAGEGTIVWNLSGKAGTYSGGNNVTYLGTYEGGEFTDTEGKVTFGGYFNQTSFSNLSGISEFSGVFEGASVTLAKGHGTFSGYFSASEITGAATNTMSGMFLNASTVRGGEGDDNFSGRFIDSTVDGGGGDNSFGYGSLNLMRNLVVSKSMHGTTSPEKYMGVEADFINATVTAGSGKDRVNGVTWGGSFDLGEGDDSTDGIFSETAFNGGGGNDTLRAGYAAGSTFDTGDGDDSVTLNTAVSNSIVTGEGTSTVTMGLNNVAASATAWQTRDELFNRERPRETGELAHNAIDASRGDNAITVNNGETSRRIIARDQDAVKERKTDENGAESQADKAVAETTQEEEIPAAAHQTMSAAIGRYREVFGMEPQNKGETAVTVDFGNGSAESFMSARREDRRENQEKAGMVQTVRRHDIDGSVSWKRWQRIEE